MNRPDTPACALFDRWSASLDNLKLARTLQAFSNAVDAQTGKSITQANATMLINVARAL